MFTVYKLFNKIGLCEWQEIKIQFDFQGKKNNKKF